jgi:hypothetical protein
MRIMNNLAQVTVFSGGSERQSTPVCMALCCYSTRDWLAGLL